MPLGYSQEYSQDWCLKKKQEREREREQDKVLILLSFRWINGWEEKKVLSITILFFLPA